MNTDANTHAYIQGLFNTLSSALVIQNKRSLDPNRFSVCMLRGTDGTMCAVGTLIDDPFYDPRLEVWGPTDDAVIDAVFASHPPPHNIDPYPVSSFLWDMVRIHDNKEIQLWPSHFIHYAREHNLTVPPIVSQAHERLCAD